MEKCMPSEVLLHPFPSTHWTLVAEAGGASSEARRAALAQLLQRYMPPLRWHLIAATGLRAEDADDMLQSFLVGPVLQDDLVGQAHEAKGRFRNFLLVALNRHVLNAQRAARAQKRLPEQAVSLEEIAEPSSSCAGTEQAFDVLWSRQVLEETIERMKRHCNALHRPDLWGVFERRVLEPSLHGHKPPSYAALLREFPFDSPTQASNAVITAKRMFARSLRSVVGEYEADEQRIDDEIIDLRRILSGGRA
jgi:DNA-directed RNA polymerase specialized sigma24 family protein